MKESTIVLPLNVLHLKKKKPKNQKPPLSWSPAFPKEDGIEGNLKEAGGLESLGVNHHVSCQFLSLSSQRPQGAINSPAALPLQPGNELGNNKEPEGVRQAKTQEPAFCSPSEHPLGIL